MGLSIVMGVPHSWMVYIMENPNLKWMIPGGTPVFWKPSQDPYIIYPLLSHIEPHENPYYFRGIPHFRKPPHADSFDFDRHDLEVRRSCEPLQS